MIEFRKDTLQELNTRLQISGYTDKDLNNDDLIKLINDLEENDKSNSKRKTQLSRTKMNRYATICNMINLFRITTIKELKT